MKRHTNVILDINNLAWIVRYGEKFDTKKKEPFAMELIAIKLINFAGDLGLQFKADGMVAAYDSKSVWRKAVYSDYKNRDHDDIYYDDVRGAIDLTKDFFEQCTSVKVAKVDHSEADDIIALIAQSSTNNVDNVIVSSDKDFMQLLKHENVKLYSTTQKEFRATEDPEYFLFEKCIRGDTSDNIFSAYPRVRATLLEKAYSDPVEMLNLMETVRKDGKKVSEAYELNRVLIDLERQPSNIRLMIIEELKKPATGNGFNQMAAMKFIREHKLIASADPILSGKFNTPFNGKFRLN